MIDMLCKVIGVQRQDNKEWIGRTVWRLDDVKAGTEYPTAIVKEDGCRCVYGAEVVMFHPDDLEVIYARVDN